MKQTIQNYLCPVCRAELKYGSNFCDICGIRLGPFPALEQRTDKKVRRKIIIICLVVCIPMIALIVIANNLNTCSLKMRFMSILSFAL